MSSSEAAAFTKTVLPISTPIGSAQYHDAVATAVEKSGKSTKTGEAVAGCVQQVLHNAGIETVGEAHGLRQDPTGHARLIKLALGCLASAAP